MVPFSDALNLCQRIRKKIIILGGNVAPEQLRPGESTPVNWARSASGFIGFNACLFTGRFRPLVTKHRADHHYNKHRFALRIKQGSNPAFESDGAKARRASI